ncbi:SRPBCC family protein [Mycobacterium sp. 663a-19]|uniref:SRPBCC family protein n=1 Tax=Mycobacterium sp. 663a-19 TaxID=2986148 RepID=UPI002D1E9E1B|nr:SRPBCC family protein [Mycobacterium sp. 663a-19]MEB3980953.1 SRPBCC family protein [Mycobacterium sp. 663a-19]
MNRNVNGFVPPLCQVAFSVVDLRVTERWFREGLGFVPAGGSRQLMRSPLAARVQGLPRAASTCWWLVGSNDWFQLELFQFERPVARLMPADARPHDIGYSRIGVCVADFDAALAALERLGSPPMTAPVGAPGARRACVRNPDGVFVEIMEDDPLAPDGRPSLKAGRLAAVRSVTLSVADLAQAEATFARGLGLKPSNAPLRSPEHETSWGLPGAQTRSRVFEAGDVLVELVEYLSPQGRPRPHDYRISDQGILNVAFGVRTKAQHAQLVQRAEDAGATPNCPPVHLPGAGVAYVNDPQQFSIELLWMAPAADRFFGFRPKPLDRRPDTDTSQARRSVTIDAPADKVWAVISDHEGMADWTPFKTVRRIADGAPEADGRGSERMLTGPTGSFVEQVVHYEAPRVYRYRIIEGSPFVCHQGEIRLEPRAGRTELTWTIRFRSRLPGTGRPLAAGFSRVLDRILHTSLKPYIEARATDYRLAER